MTTTPETITTPMVRQERVSNPSSVRGRRRTAHGHRGPNASSVGNGRSSAHDSETVRVRMIAKYPADSQEAGRRQPRPTGRSVEAALEVVVISNLGQNGTNECYILIHPTPAIADDALQADFMAHRLDPSSNFVPNRFSRRQAY